MPLFIGLDLGTQGVRGIVSDEAGSVIVSESTKFDEQMINSPEQDVSVWQASVLEVLNSIAVQLKSTKNEILSISVTSTSGTIIPINRNLQPIYNAIMYHNSEGHSYFKKMRNEGNYISPIHAKVLWFQNERKTQDKDLYKFIHANDYLVLLLTGKQIISDYSSSLKSGYDVLSNQWNNTDQALQTLFPKVDEPGAIVGNLSEEINKKTNLPQGIKVVLGMTDGCTGFLSTGCSKEGDWCTTIGTTMVIKGLSKQYIKDDVFYSHKHPDDLWMPGGASNIGAKWVSHYGFDENLDYYNEYARNNRIAKQFHYPLVGMGERFPFHDETIKGFDHTNSFEESFLAGMEGVAFIERMAYEKMEKDYGVTINNIFSAGSAGQNKVWNRIRSNILKKPIIAAGNEGSAFGAAIIAASATYYDSLIDASINMKQTKKAVIEEYTFKEKYDEKYLKFKKLLKNTN